MAVLGNYSGLGCKNAEVTILSVDGANCIAPFARKQTLPGVVMGVPSIQTHMEAPGAEHHLPNLDIHLAVARRVFVGVDYGTGKSRTVARAVAKP